MSIIIPNLGLIDIHDTALAEYAADKVTKINLVAAFAAVVPTTGDVDAKKIEYQDALTAADDGTKADTAFKDARRKELEALLTLQAQNCAEIANGDLALYLSSGYKAKDTQGAPTGALPAVTGFLLDYGDDDGQLKANWDAMVDAKNFSIQVFSDINNPATTIIKEYIKGKIGKQKTVLDGLPSGQKVFARVRANGGSTGQGPWSDVAEKRVP